MDPIHYTRCSRISIWKLETSGLLRAYLLRDRLGWDKYSPEPGKNGYDGASETTELKQG